VIVPSHRSRERLAACLDGLAGQSLPPEAYEVHVVDTGEDGAGDLVESRARDWRPRLAYHRANGLGPGRQRNQGVESVATEYVAFVDSDCVPEPGWLEAGLARLREGATIVQGPTLTPDGVPPPPFAHAIFVESQSPMYESCNVMYRRQALRDAGGFSVDLFDRDGVHLGEDTELGWRVARRGGTTSFEPRAIVRHAVATVPFRDHLAYQWQARYFPRLVGRVPELRREALTAGLFLGPRSLRTLGLLAGLLLGRRHRLAYALAAPYLLRIGSNAARATTPRSAGAGAVKTIISDLVRQAALLWGSVRNRSTVL